MQRADVVKTKSVPKRLRRYLPAICIVVVGLLVVLVFLKHAQPHKLLHVNGRTYTVLLATTPTQQAKGLGDRASLPADQGMLFVFPNQAVRCFWMKDTHFSLDMIWLNAQKHIVHIESHVSPESYPETFCPSQTAQYVLELDAGQAQTAKLHNGQTLNF
jgi:uncharacterized membrane protein (UPF0127 family)